MKTDLILQQEIFNELKREPMLENFIPKLDVINGIVTVSGTVDCFAKKVMAESIIKKISGVRVIIEEIYVSLPLEMRMSDNELLQIILNMLSWNNSIPGKNIEVSVRKSWVTLSGKLDWQYQKEATYAALVDVVGIKGITDLISITKGVYLPDAGEIEHKMMPRVPGTQQVEHSSSLNSLCSKLYGKISCFFEPEEVEVTFKEEFGKRVRYTYTKATLKELYIAHRS